MPREAQAGGAPKTRPDTRPEKESLSCYVPQTSVHSISTATCRPRSVRMPWTSRPRPSTVCTLTFPRGVVRYGRVAELPAVGHVRLGAELTLPDGPEADGALRGVGGAAFLR